MKVKDIIKKYNCSSNASVVVKYLGNEIYRIGKAEIEAIPENTVMNATVASVDIIDNVFTIHVKG